MRKSKTIKIDDKEITIKELKVKDIRKLLEMPETDKDDTMELVEKFLPVVTDLKLSDLDEMAPSELKILWEAFKEVNADFLEVTGRLGITKMLGSLIRKHLNEAFAGLLSEAISISGTTDGVSS